MNEPVVRAVVEKARGRRDMCLDFAVIENAKTTTIARERFFRYYGQAIGWSDIVDDLLAALGEPRDGLTLPWDDAPEPTP